MYQYEPNENNNYNNGQNQADYYTTFVPYGFSPKTYRERAEIRKSAIIIGISLLVLTAISLFWAEIYYLITGNIGISAEKAYEIISEPAVLQFAQIILSTLMFTIPFIIVTKVNSIRISSLVSLKKVKKNEAFPLFLMGLSFCAFANIVTAFAGSIFESFGFNYNVDFGDNPTGVLGFMLTFISTAIIPALVEEFAFRGIVLGLLRKHGDAFAIIVSAILFGLVHGNFQQIPFAFLVGLALGYITVKTNSLLVAMAVHSANNFVSVVFDYWNVSAALQNAVYMIYLLVCLLSGVLGLFLYAKTENGLSIGGEITESSEKQKNKWFFTSPLIIIFCVISLIEAIGFFFI